MRGVAALFAIVSCSLCSVSVTGDDGVYDDRGAYLHRAQMELMKRRGRHKFANEEMEALAFLVRFMPEADVEKLNVSFVVANVIDAVSMRHSKRVPWAENVPWKLFLNDVLPYAALTERRDAWRSQFSDFLLPKLNRSSNNASMAGLIEKINTISWTIVDPPIKFIAAPPDQVNSYSPLQTMASHGASCTGLSVFLVDMLRSVGIPARSCGTPHWNHGEKECPQGAFHSIFF